MGRQIVDASIVEAPWQRNTKQEKTGIRAGRIYHRKLRFKPMPAHMIRGNRPASRIRA